MKRMTWDDMYERAEQYYHKYGNLLIPKTYICDDGVRLGQWINTQRAVNYGLRTGILDSERKDKLNAIGMDWNPNLTAWNKAYDELIKYKTEYGNIDVPIRYVSTSGFQLGLWLQNQRRAFLRKGRGKLDDKQ